ncbi:Reverse transcriptase domain-containing protein [Abeliophyllum distichum]|uniref:Reverse transcriptase domain-containing protein n=1 Tax=Abeliophyllum distichum TaxID=126358 RepID=A0ABD1VXY8_9LAMI
MTSTSCYSIPVNWKNLLNEKFDEMIAQRKNRGQSISIKKEPFTEKLTCLHLPLKFKEPTDNFDGMTAPIDQIQTFQDQVRLHGWPDAIACRTFPMTLKKDAM